MFERGLGERNLKGRGREKEGWGRDRGSEGARELGREQMCNQERKRNEKYERRKSGGGGSRSGGLRGHLGSYSERMS
jgi:hypothetical protein